MSERKLAELRAKLGSVRRELDAWRAVSEPDAPLEKFHTRVRAVDNALDELVGPLERRLEDSGARALDLGVGFELSILEVHRVWEFFRAKFALRYVPHLEHYLIAADDFAWACYAPAQGHRREGEGREPALLFLNGASSPFTLPRGAAYSAEEVEGEAMSGAELGDVLESLPIPVIGLPWFALEHLPDTLVVAHETGHDVQRDLALDATLDRLIADAVADEQRRAVWQAWRDELFADLYATSAAGPAFAGALMDFVADAVVRVASEQPTKHSAYPTRSLRVMLVLEALRRRGFAEAAEAYRVSWDATYEQDASGAYADDVPAVVAAVLDGPYPELGGAGLEALDPFTAAMDQRARASAEDVLRGKAPRADHARELFAAARLAYERDSARYESRRAAGLVVKKACDMQSVGVRGRGDADQAPPQSARDARDRRAGRTLRGVIAARHGLTDLDDATGGDDVQAQEPD